MIADKIKFLREKKGITQAELAKKLSVTRSSVNAWEMAISVPSIQYLVELSAYYGVSVDYLLELKRDSSLDISGLGNKEVGILVELVDVFRSRNCEE